MLAKLKGFTAALLLALALAMLAPGVQPILAQDDGERRDETMGTSDHMRTGTNERGDNVMVIERKPQKKQEMPNMGPMYVVPQVNQGGTNVPVVIPVTPPPTQPQPKPGK